MKAEAALPKRKTYSSDLAAHAWQRMEPLLAHVRRRSKWPLRELVNASLYVLKSGCLWRDVPGESPPWGTGYWSFSKWPAAGVLDEINAFLAADCRARAQKKPSCVVIDTQSVKNAATATGDTVGFDTGKLGKGRKRLVRSDTLGNILASWVGPAGESDAATASAFWDAVAAQLPLLGQGGMGDSSFAGLLAEHLRQRYGLRFEKPMHIVLKRRTSAFIRSVGWANARWLG